MKSGRPNNLELGLTPGNGPPGMLGLTPGNVGLTPGNVELGLTPGNGPPGMRAPLNRRNLTAPNGAAPTIENGAHPAIAIRAGIPFVTDASNGAERSECLRNVPAAF